MSAGVEVARDSGSEYVLSVIEKYAVRAEAARAAEQLFPVLREWAGPDLVDIWLSGSYAKGTATALGTDVDVFVSLSEGARLSIKDIYWELFHWLRRRRLRPAASNVALRVEMDGIAVDLVPGRLRPSSGGSHLAKGASGALPPARLQTRMGDHMLYWRKKDNWVQTNVAEHIRLVTGSGRTREIRALKIWRERQRLDFSSFYLELTVMNCLRGQRAQGLGEDVRRVLHFLAHEFIRVRVVDPANSNNVISEDYGREERRRIARAARKSLDAKRWENILW